MDVSKIEFAENVLVIDVKTLNDMIVGVKQFFEDKLQRNLQDIKVNELIDFMSLDMHLTPGGNECMVIWVYDDTCKEIVCCSKPSDLAKGLHEVGFDDSIGNFTLFGAPTKQLVSPKDLLLNLTELCVDSKRVKRIGVLPASNSYDKELTAIFKEMKDKSAFVFQPNSIEIDGIETCNPFYPIMQALGIKGNEIQ